MTNKNTKKSLIASILVLCMCFTMLVGTTFAWFTDSATSSGNVIKTGTLDVELKKWTSATESVKIEKDSDPLFGADTIWEPGRTQVVYLSVKNNGSLDLKYTVGLEVYGIEKNLNEVVSYAITPDAKYDSIDSWVGNGTKVVPGTNATQSNNVSLLAGEEHFFALSVHMDELAGNDYMNGNINFDIKVLATQFASEYDSFGNQYDEDAFYYDELVTTADELYAAVANATGDIDTNFSGKAEYALDGLKTNDFVYIHMEAPDECGHRGEAKNKIKSIELIDELVVKKVKEGLDKLGEDYTIMILPDHPTPIETKTHAPEPVPYLIYSNAKNNCTNSSSYCEEEGTKSNILINDGYTLIDKFINYAK